MGENIQTVQEGKESVWKL